MPLYEYECDACGHRFEVIQKFSDAPVDRCPACGSSVHKLQSAPAFHLKGTGWYATDYAKPGNTAESKSNRDGNKAEGGSESGSSGEKPASTEAASKSSSSAGSTESGGSASGPPAKAESSKT
jgi:putative FmdB family regulatory protein